jgi:NRAMP (natural resistance-associated macrophage protein)-like metal ion transporter
MIDEEIKKIVEAPAKVLDVTVEKSKYIFSIGGQPVKTVKNYWHNLGPGLTTGAADDDPSGIATYSQTGSRYGLQLLWLAPLTFPFAAMVQEMCARIGLVTGRGLAGNIHKHFSKKILYVTATLLFAANVFNIGADLGAMAKGMQLIIPHLNFSVLVIFFALFGLALQIFSTYEKYAKYLKWMALVLFSYVFSTLSIPHLDWVSIFHHIVFPTITFSKDQILIICAIFGTTISPYLFFWQTSQEVEEEIQLGKTTLAMRQVETTDEEIKNMRVDVWSGNLLSELIMFFIIVASGLTLYQHGITNITTAADAAGALRPFAGDGAYFLFAIGIIGTGLLSIPVLAGSASYAIAEGFGWKTGLYRDLRKAYGFYGVIILATLLGIVMNFIGLDPIKALIYSAVLNGLVAPIVLVLILLISSNKKIMGNRVNHPTVRWLGWLITGVMIISCIAAVITLFV